MTADGLTGVVVIEANSWAGRVQGARERYRSPRTVIEEVLASPGVAGGIDELAAKLFRNRDGVLSDVREYLEEMASVQSPLAVDLWVRWARWLYSGAYRLVVNDAQVERVRQLGQSHPLVFLPSHRSNLDPYVLSSLLYERGLPQNHTLGGINMAFWPLGSIGRKVGVIFIRRSFRDNDVYRFVLERYLAFLVTKRFNLEWYIEGTRSRTGKLMPPRMGLLNYLVDAVDGLERRDVHLVPTSIIYDLLSEVGEMTDESKGQSKRGEGLRWLIGYARRQRRPIGAVHVSFGEPLNLAEAIRGDSPDGPTTEESRRLARSKIAFEVCVRINRATMMTGPALMLFALLGEEDRALTLPEVGQVLGPVLRYAETRGIPLDAQAEALAGSAGVERTLALLVSHEVVEEYHGGPHPVFRVGPAQQLVAAFYRNSIAHWFVTRALVELTVLDGVRHPRGDDAMRQGWQEALRLRDLLKFEFFFPDKREFAKELAGEMALIRPDWQDAWRNEHVEVRQALVDSGLLVAHRAIRSFLEAYSVVAHQLESLGSRSAEADEVVGKCLGRGEQFLRQRRITSAEAVSTHLFRTGMKLAQNRGLVAGGPSAPVARRAFVDELDDVLARVGEIHDLDRRRYSQKQLTTEE